MKLNHPKKISCRCDGDCSGTKLVAKIALRNGVQPVAHLASDEHGLAVGNLGNLQVSGVILVQRQPALFATDALLWDCHFLSCSA